MKLRFGFLAPLILLSGCGLPPAVIVASYAADGVSYLASGKSLTDHALSTVAQRDCALHRLVTEALLCREDILGDLGTLAASDESGANANPDLLAKRSQPRWGPVEVLEANARDEVPASETTVSDATYLVVGSFLYWVNTERFAQQYPMLNAEVVPATVDGQLVYRVVTIASPDAVAEAGIDKVWPLRLCRDIEDVLAPCNEDRRAVVNVAALAR